jgi:hypothetical protein
MDEKQMLEALSAHWQATAVGDANAEHDIYEAIANFASSCRSFRLLGAQLKTDPMHMQRCHSTRWELKAVRW